MVVIFGGAYQGKLDYAISAYGLTEDDIFDCAEEKGTEIDFSKKAVYHFEQFTLACTRAGKEAADYLKEHEEELEDKIFIGTDISQGLVPMEKELREWREMNGRANIYLGKKADRVTRVFCGLPQDIKYIKTKKEQNSYIHLIRHGTTEGNVRRCYYGYADIPLLDEGKKLLEKLRDDGIYPKMTNADFYTTGMVRTEETLKTIFGEVEHEVIGELKEMNFGDFEMHTYEELSELEAYQEWINEKEGLAAPPNGESRADFQKRVLKGFEKLLGMHRLKEFSMRHAGAEANSAVVCHGGVISALMMSYFPENDKNFYTWIPDPGHGYTITIKNGKPAEYEKF